MNVRVESISMVKSEKSVKLNKYFEVLSVTACGRGVCIWGLVPLDNVDRSIEFEFFYRRAGQSFQVIDYAPGAEHPDIEFLGTVQIDAESGKEFVHVFLKRIGNFDS